MFPFNCDHIDHRSYHFMDSCLMRESLVPGLLHHNITDIQTISHSHKSSAFAAEKVIQVPEVGLWNGNNWHSWSQGWHHFKLGLFSTTPKWSQEQDSKCKQVVEIINEGFHSKEDFWGATAHLIVHKNGNSDKKSENITLKKDDLLKFLQLSFKTTIVMAAVIQWYLSHHPVLAMNLLHIGENLSGVRLLEALRKKLPGLLPSVTQDTNLCQNIVMVQQVV